MNFFYWNLSTACLLALSGPSQGRQHPQPGPEGEGGGRGGGGEGPWEQEVLQEGDDGGAAGVPGRGDL